jgi:hypothetical protein
LRFANESEERAINLANAKIQLPSQREAKSDQGRNGLKARGNGLDFLGYNFSLALAAHGPKRRYWRVAPSKKSVQTRDSTTASDDLQPTATYTDYRINRTAQPAPAGMENYYGKRHCGAAMQRIN